ncbi:Sec23/Sec24 trunk domain-containing protein, partial [Chytriomyces sp. MP71]
MPIHQFDNNPAAAPIQPRPMGPPMGASGNLGPQPQAPTGRRAYPSQPPAQLPMGPQSDSGSGFNSQQNPYGQQPRMGPPGPQPGQPQQYVQSATVPQFGAPKPGPPQYGGPAGPVTRGYGLQTQAGPVYGQPPGPGFQTADPPAFGGQPQFQAGFPGGTPMNHLQNGMQNMNMGSGGIPRNPAAPTAVNLLQKPPSITDLDTMLPPPSMAATQSVSQSPHSLCPPSYKRCTMTAIPQTQPVLAKCKIPLGLIVTPYRTLQPGEEPVPVVNPPQIVRCRRCRAYINPWVQFVEQGTRWKCNMCFLTNEVPGFFDWDGEARQQVDRMKRPELTHSVVEYIAPQEYMVRPPQPVVLLFLLDVTCPAVQSGMLEAVCKSLLACLDEFPNADGRTKVGFIAVDSALHFFNLNSGLADPEMLVVADIEDTFIPLPEDLLVPLSESRLVIEKLLAGLPNMFRGAAAMQNCLGRALQAAFKMIVSSLSRP